MNRRKWLQLATASPATLLAQGESESTRRTPGERRLFLFVDWYHVNKGDMRAVLDPDRLSDDGRKLLDDYRRNYTLDFTSGPHGFRRVDVPYGVRLTPELAGRSKPWLGADAPWEKDFGYHSVHHEEGRYRCWYYAMLRGEKTGTTIESGRAMEISGSALAYAESTDGWTWTKPELDLVSYRGSRRNNLISPLGNTSFVFRDEHGAPEERYKAFHFDLLPEREIPKNAPPLQRYGLYGISSPDGLHWKKKPKVLVRHFADTQNVAVWDPVLGKYVAYFRDHVNGRSISRAETEDFWNWPHPTPLVYTGPLDSPSDDLYTNGYTTYPGEPSLRLLFPAVYHRDTDSVDARMMVSREGRSFQWVSYDPVIRNGGAGEWDHGGIYPSPNLVHLPDGRLALPYRGYRTTHNEHWFSTFYRQYERPSFAGWALWKDGRLAGIEAGSRGEFSTKPARFDGSRIQINARTSRSGSVEVELRERGQALKGFSFADCIPFAGDEIWTDCRWKGGSDLTAVRGANLTLAIRLHSAKIFAYRYVG